MSVHVEPLGAVALLTCSFRLPEPCTHCGVSDAECRASSRRVQVLRELGVRGAELEALDAWSEPLDVNSPCCARCSHPVLRCHRPARWLIVGCVANRHSFRYACHAHREALTSEAEGL